MTPLLRDFERFLNAPGDLPLVVQLALAHYQFEAIHPFMDGNARLGRLLNTLTLCERRALPQPLLYLSAYFEHHDAEYKGLLYEVSRRGAWGEWIEWIEFFARGVAEQARDAVRRANRLLALWRAYREKFQAESQSTAALRLLDALFAAPMITVPAAQRLLDLTPTGARMNVEKLVAAGILRETTGKARNRVYVAPAILDLLGERFDEATFPLERDDDLAHRVLIDCMRPDIEPNRRER